MGHHFLLEARMIFAGYTFKNEKPLKKSISQEWYGTCSAENVQVVGNSPDALKLMDRYGADGVRFGVLSCAAAGNDLLFEEKLCEKRKKLHQ